MLCKREETKSPVVPLRNTTLATCHTVYIAFLGKNLVSKSNKNINRVNRPLIESQTAGSVMSLDSTRQMNARRK